MQTVIRTADTGAGTLYNRRGGIGNRHQPGRGGAEEKASSPARKRNGFLTGRLLPVTADYHVDSPEKGTSINLTTREGFEYLSLRNKCWKSANYKTNTQFYTQ